MRAIAPMQRRLGRLERGLAGRLRVSHRELRDWTKLGGLAAGMAALTAIGGLLIG